MAPNEIRVFLADDHAIVREGLAALFASQPGFLVVGQCGDGLKVFEQVQSTQPDVVVLDISMPGLNGLDLCEEIVRKTSSKVLMLTMHREDQFVVRALNAGAKGYLLKDSAGEQLAKAVQAVSKEEIFLGPGISREVLEQMDESGDPFPSLSMRERQVLQMIAEGMTNRVIASTLDLAVKTVDTHRTRLMRKLDIHDQTTLVKFAISRGMVPLPGKPKDKKV